MDTPRFLGAAFIFVFFATLLTGILRTSAVGSGSISDILVNISKNLTQMRIYIIVDLANSLGIVLLAVLLYVALHKQNNILALVALGWWLAEAITLAVSKIGAYALMPLSQEFVAAGAPQSSYFQTWGDFLYYGLDRTGYNVVMLFFCLGAILWYYLFYISGYIPQILSLWGLAAVCLLTIPVLLQLYDRDFTRARVMGLLYAPYELVLGVWLILRGFN